jgi:hypothetical protein
MLEKIKHVISWLPILWHDVPWSGEYGVMRILSFKLTQIEDFLHGEYSVAVHHPKALRGLKVAKNLCKRLADENYIHNATMFEEERFNNLTLGYPRTREERLTQEWFNRKCRHATEMETQDRDRLYKMLQKYLPAWWD